MRYTLFENRRDELLLIARLFLVIPFLLFGWSKLTGFSGTIAYMATENAPLPTVAAVIAVVMELLVGLAIAVGFYTRPLAYLLTLYTLATAFIGHHYWTMPDAERMANMINFYKNLSIAGGLLLLCIAGPGKYSLDRR